MDKTPKNAASSFTVYHAIVICVAGIVAFTIFMIMWPSIQEAIELWQLQQDRQEHISSCKVNEEQEHARAVLCPNKTP